jgi:hypothetical protein
MKLRYIILGSSLFAWSAAVTEILIHYTEVDVFLGRPLIYFVILLAGISIGYGLKGGK